MLNRTHNKILTIVGSFIVAYGWSWYHLSRHNPTQFFLWVGALWLGVAWLWTVTKQVFRYLARRFKRHPFWHQQFISAADELFFFCSLLFIIFFFKNEVVSLVYTCLLLPIIGWRVQKTLRQHPGSTPWLVVNATTLTFGYFLFVVEAIFQYLAYHYYILDANIRFFNIVLFRSLAMTMFWLLGFAIVSSIYWCARGWRRYVPFIIWSLFFAMNLLVWEINIGILYYSGLYFSPVAWGHASGAGGVIGVVMIWYILALLILLGTTGFILYKTIRAQRLAPAKYWIIYNIIFGCLSLAGLFGLTSFRNTPEHDIVKSFYQFFLGTDAKVTLTPTLQKKLATFGLEYHPNDFYVARRETVFNATSTPLLPAKLVTNKPNILIIFFESFSARLTDVYNPYFTDLTPGLDLMAADPATTIFHRYYNASTPTITGTLSQLCSFLPPTGHNEIQNERKLQNHHLLCLPEVLKKQAGFSYAAYVTAVDKEFAHKDGIFASMGVDKIFGTSELKKYIPGPPLSWGYSDHQMFPVIWNFMQEHNQSISKNQATQNQTPQESKQGPFLMMLATVDTHPPFNLAKDVVNYRDGSNDVSNSFHTTDDAFLKFWQQFKQSSLATNTIVIAVADHAIFPGALTQAINQWPGQADQDSLRTYYDQNLLMMYIPDNVLPKKIDILSSGLDLMPTLLQMFNINIPNQFEGHSIFDDRTRYPNVLGMHELGLYINQVSKKVKRKIEYNVPSEISCPSNYSVTSTPELTLCDYLQFYHWKRQMFEEGRFWKF